LSPQSFRLEEATIDEIHSAFRSGELTCRRLVELYLARVRRQRAHHHFPKNLSRN
jgi:Asp-tRNA(Asn)/Glu-tRNA(Gln) amidotransferase A subunit family amidase